MLFASIALAAMVAAPPKTEVLVLGVAHLVARRDVHNSTFTDSPLSAARQAQINDVVDRLARFHPTKVLIEAPYGNPVWAQRYAGYRSGTFTLGADEVYQFGFKLAAKAGNTTIYPVDNDGPSMIDESTASGKRIMAFLKAKFNDVNDPQFSAYLKRDDDLERNGTYLDLLRYLNSDEAIRANASWYAVFAGEGLASDYAGAAYTGQWYARNAYIFANVLNVIQPGDRVVLIMGQGHEFLLRQFIRLNPNLTYIDALDYLR